MKKTDIVDNNKPFKYPFLFVFLPNNKPIINIMILPIIIIIILLVLILTKFMMVKNIGNKIIYNKNNIKDLIYL